MDCFSYGTKLPSNLEVQSYETQNGVRTVKVTRSALLDSDDIFDFPYEPMDVSIIAAYGNQLQFNSSTSSMGGSGLVDTLSFVPLNSSGGSNTSNATGGCTAGVTSYGTQGKLADGFTIGLRIYCEAKTIQLSVES